MTNEQQIIDNAPEGWTHFDPSGEFYYKEIKDGSYMWSHGDTWTDITYEESFCRSRSDIERIVELEKVNEKLKLEAQIHACEDDTHKAIVFEIYKALGIQGKADWNGAAPVKAAVNNIKADAIVSAIKGLDVDKPMYVNNDQTFDAIRGCLYAFANQLRNEVK